MARYDDRESPTNKDEVSVESNAERIQKLRDDYERRIKWETFGLESNLWFEVSPQTRVWSELSRSRRILTLGDLINNIDIVKNTKWIGPKAIEAIQVLLELCVEKGTITPEDYKIGLLQPPSKDLEA